MKYWILLLLFMLPVFPEEGEQSGELTTFILFRHAEKVDDSRDPDLSDDGYARAKHLSEMLNYVRPDAVYSTPFKRTRRTIRPVADKHRLELMEYDHRSPEDTAARWIKDHRGETLLISGHSNSTPMHANALLGREHFPEKFDESDYGNLLIILVSSDDEAKLLHLRY